MDAKVRASAICMMRKRKEPFILTDRCDFCKRTDGQIVDRKLALIWREPSNAKARVEHGDEKRKWDRLWEESG